MQFNKPTTKDEMYVILNDLFYYYRIKRNGYEEVSLKELELKRLEFINLSQEELREKAKSLLNAEHFRKVQDYKESVEEQMIALNSKINSLDGEYEKLIEKVEKLYLDSQEKLKNILEKSSLIYSSAYFDKTAVLESEKNAQIAILNSQKEEKAGELTASLAVLSQKKVDAGTRFDEEFAKEIDAKTIELLDEQEKIAREVFKYNNGLDEKEQRYANTITQTNANLNLKFMEISMGEFTKDQLVEMGYYDDVIACVCGYYDTLAPTPAYQDIANESKLAIYLDDYYMNIVYMYGVKAGIK